MYNSYNRDSMIQYVVKTNDSLYKIAKAYNTTVEDLKTINHLYSNTIYPNQILLIPVNDNQNVNSNIGSSNSCKTYITSNGETINDILSKYSLSYETLYSLNDLNKLRLEGNQMLCVGASKNNTHTVVATDTIEYILSKYNLSPLDFLKLNENKILRIGEEIIIA